jgi:putative glutamine amidotransferase
VSDLDTTSFDPDEVEDRRPEGVAVSALKPRDCDCGRVPTSYVTAVRRAGSVPFVLSSHELCEDEGIPDDLEVMQGLPPDEVAPLEWASGLVLTGGGDVDPALYGQRPHPRTYNVSPRRDRFELNLLESALRRDLPVLAICRGMQLLNVYFGGSLEQHLLDVPGRLAHDRDRPRAEPAHEVRATEGSLLADLVGERTQVNSHHHQGLDVVADGLEEIGYSEDGVLEAVVARDYTWVLGVQWHPEAMVPFDARQEAIFTGFVQASAARAGHASERARVS